MVSMIASPVRSMTCRTPCPRRDATSRSAPRFVCLVHFAPTLKSFALQPQVGQSPCKASRQEEEVDKPDTHPQGAEQERKS